MGEKRQEKIWTGQFWIAVINNFFLFVVHYALLTSLPLYILYELNGNEGQAGLAMAIFMLSAIIVRPFAGKIIEVFGKRKTLLISELFFCLSSVLYIFIDSLPLLLALRLFHGIWFSILTTVLIAIVNDIIPESRKGAGIGYFMMSNNLAIVFGPLIVLAGLQWFPYKVLFTSLATVVFMSFLFIFSLKVTEYPSPLSTVKRNRLTWEDFIESKAIPIAIVGALTAFSYAGVLSFISVFAETRDVFEYVSLFFIVFAIAMMIVRPFTGKLYDTKGPNSVIYPSFFFFTVGLFMLSNIHTVPTLLVAGALIGIGYGSIFPCLQALAIQSTHKHRSGHATSTFFTLFDGGLAIGAILLGVVSAQWGYTIMYIFCGVIVILTALIYWRLVSVKKSDTYNKPEEHLSLKQSS